MPIFLQLNMVPIHAINHSSYLSSWFDYIHTLLNRYAILLFIDSCSEREHARLEVCLSPEICL
jgi:hypothetical protein